MTGQMFISVYDDTHDKFADKIEYDLWRINNTDRIFIKHDIVHENNQNILFTVNTIDDFGCYEVVLNIKDYFERFNENIDLPTSQYTIPVGMNELDKSYHLGIHITPTQVSCVL
ncbi:unnamed protein product [Rotaria sordida]|uniref:Uncharacterized protein n=1 Tax=Rotaria sordida TaxID=392033 RepID=A0A819D5L5_9BILA|nr:unnamed protein product [Rotaria sordida]CAF0939128.1 unnamed protein product [Rotaria sordida]CAF3823427.1 unnamed protein product [Rotaria sordida]